MKIDPDVHMNVLFGLSLGCFLGALVLGVLLWHAEGKAGVVQDKAEALRLSGCYPPTNESVVCCRTKPVANSVYPVVMECSAFSLDLNQTGEWYEIRGGQ